MSSVAIKRPPPPPATASSPGSSFGCKAGITSPPLRSPPPLNRPPQPAPSPSSTTPSSPPPLHDQAPKKPPAVLLFSEADLDRRLRERDDEWRKHEKAQIVFLQNEGGNMLRGLHQEIDRLSYKLRDARRLLDIGGCATEKEMAEQLRERKKRVAELEEELAAKEQRLGEIEGKVTVAVERMSEQIAVQAERIRQLHNELADRTATVAQLSNQLRAYRLREAMSIAQQRRRVSNPNIKGGSTGGTPPLVSPSSPHRTFPPGGFFGTLTYPGGSGRSTYAASPSTPIVSSPLSAVPDLTGKNIDEKVRPARRRSASSYNAQISPGSVPK